jgi:hypothetical protein
MLALPTWAMPSCLQVLPVDQLLVPSEDGSEAQVGTGNRLLVIPWKLCCA